MKIKKILLIATSALMISACGTPSVKDLVEDPELLSEVLQECQTLMMQGKASDSEKCTNAQAATIKVTQNVVKGLLGG